MTQADQLKPCPFCGYDKPMFHEDGSDSYIGCLCGARIGCHRYFQVVADEWNTRAEGPNIRSEHSDRAAEVVPDAKVVELIRVAQDLISEYWRPDALAGPWV